MTINSLILGTRQFEHDLPARRREYVNLIREAVDLGIRQFDTAESYGNGQVEKLLGAALKGIRKDVLIYSKFSPNHSAPERITQALNLSLKRLQTDYLDIYFQHWPSAGHSLELTVCELERLKKSGILGATGVSNWRSVEFSECVKLNPNFAQCCVNLLWQKETKEVIPILTARKIKAFGYSPLCEGLLGGGDLLSKRLARSKNVFYSTAARAQILPFLDKYRQLAMQLSLLPAQLALLWALKQPVEGIIIGVSSSTQLKELVFAANCSLTTSDLAQINSVVSGFSLSIVDQADSLWGWHSRAKMAT